MNKFEQLQETLTVCGSAEMMVYGFSMYPEIKNGSLVLYHKCEKYSSGDIVFCKIRGLYSAAQKIVSFSSAKGYLVANGLGWEQGWTMNVYGRVIQATCKKVITYRHPAFV